MVATYNTNVLSRKMEVRTVIHQPGTSATAQLADLGQPQGGGNKCLPIAIFRRFLAQVTASVLTGNGIVAFSIYAATAEDGTGGVAVVTHAVGSAPDAEGDSLFLECDVEQIREVLPTATHVGVWLDAANNADEAALTFIRAEPTFPGNEPTEDYVAA